MLSSAARRSGAAGPGSGHQLHRRRVRSAVGEPPRADRLVLVVAAEALAPGADRRGHDPAPRAEPGVELADVVQQGPGDLGPARRGAAGEEAPGHLDRVASVGVRQAPPQHRLRGHRASAAPTRRPRPTAGATTARWRTGAPGGRRSWGVDAVRRFWGANSSVRARFCLWKSGGRGGGRRGRPATGVPGSPWCTPGWSRSRRGRASPAPPAGRRRGRACGWRSCGAARAARSARCRAGRPGARTS